jgi:hypothetical protein
MGLPNNLGRLSPAITSDASLNIGIGVTPSGSFKFEVGSTSKFTGVATFGSTLSNGTYSYTLPSATGTLALTSDIPSVSGYVPYTGATQSVDLGTFDLTSRYLVAAGAPALGGVISMRQDAAYLPKGNGYSSIASSGVLFDFYGYTGVSTYKNFSFRFDSLTNNTNRTYTLPDATGTLALVGGAGVGTVTSVAAITLGTSGTDLSSTVANGTTTPVITLNVPDASASNRGVVTTGTQTFAGAKTFSSQLTLSSTISNGTYTYTLPSATGTLALTSALSGYLPLTGGTLTGSLTINGGGLLTLLGAKIGGDAGGTIDFNYNTGGTPLFTWWGGTTSSKFSVTSTGAATFSSSVTGGAGADGSGYMLKGTDGVAFRAIDPTATGGGASNVNIGAIGTASGDFRIHATNVLFLSNGGTAERMRITSGGNVGIGTTDLTSVRLRVKGVDTTSSNFAAYFENSSAAAMLVLRNDGLVAFPQINNFTTGNSPNTWINPASSYGIYINTSSRKYKKDISNYDKGIDIVNQLRPVYYKGISEVDGDKQFVGLIAEEIHDLGLTEFVNYNEEGLPNSLSYPNMIALAFKAIQELSEKIKTLENK